MIDPSLAAKLFPSPSDGQSPSSHAAPLLMGVLNVTPDSFSDGGAFLEANSAVSQGLRLLDEGADILDIGGESTRPPGKTYGEGSVRVSIDEELGRVLPPIIGILESAPNAIISIDTTKSEVARRAVEAGASIINDVSAGTFDPEMFAVTGSLGVPIILMHGYGPQFQKPSIEEYSYNDVLEEVMSFLRERIRIAHEAGVTQVLCDVGIGFAKGYRDNMQLIRDHARFLELGVPMVLGLSRKSSIGKAMGREVPPNERTSGSLAAAIYGAMNGASIIRTHDVLATRDAFNVLSAIAHDGRPLSNPM